MRPGTGRASQDDRQRTELAGTTTNARGTTRPLTRGAENMRVLATPEGGQVPYYRVAQLSYNSVEDLRAGITSEDGRSTIDDLANFATGRVTMLIVEEDD